MIELLPRGVFRHYRTTCCQAPIFEEVRSDAHLFQCAGCHGSMNIDTVILISPYHRDKWTEMYDIMRP